MDGRRVRPVYAVLVVFAIFIIGGCVDMVTNKEVIYEASWFGQACDGQGRGVADATVVLHVLHAGREVYARPTVTESSEPVRGIYAFEHIDLRDGADSAYTTCNVTVGNRTSSAVGAVRPLAGTARQSAMSVNGKNITIITYDCAVDDRLVLK